MSSVAAGGTTAVDVPAGGRCVAVVGGLAVLWPVGGGGVGDGVSVGLGKSSDGVGASEASEAAGGTAATESVGTGLSMTEAVGPTVATGALARGDTAGVRAPNPIHITTTTTSARAKAAAITASSVTDERGDGACCVPAKETAET